MVATIPNFLFLLDLDLDAAGALLLHMVCVSGTAVLLEATGGTAVVYVGDNKLSGERLPLLPLVLFSKM